MCHERAHSHVWLALAALETPLAGTQEVRLGVWLNGRENMVTLHLHYGGIKGPNAEGLQKVLHTGHVRQPAESGALTVWHVAVDDVAPSLAIGMHRTRPRVGCELRATVDDNRIIPTR